MTQSALSKSDVHTLFSQAPLIFDDMIKRAIMWWFIYKQNALRNAIFSFDLFDSLAKIQLSIWINIKCMHHNYRLYIYTGND